MLDTLLSGPFVPFTLSLALLFALLVLEIIVTLVGGSLIGDGGEAEIDLEPGGGAEVELGVDLDGLDLDPGEFDLGVDEMVPEIAPPQVGAAPSPLSWLGLGRMPTLIWLAALFLSFGVSGLTLQAGVSGLLGSPLPASLATIPSALVALWATGRFGALFARLLPKTETQSVSTRQLGRRMGRVTQGTARRGMPAEVRVTDRYGNTHYLRAEPLEDGVEISQGAEVLVLRHRPTGGFRLIALS